MENATETTNSLRYLVSLAQIPDEAFWSQHDCGLSDLQKKIHYTWGLSSPLISYHMASPIDGVPPKHVHILDDEDFETWLQRDKSNMQCKPLTNRLVVSDAHTLVACSHTTGGTRVQRRPLLDATSLQATGGVVALRHSGGECLLIAGAVDPLCWGNLVKKAQRCWNVHRPVFRYVDEDESGSRCVISIMDADDFLLWKQRRLTSVPELTVFEHAPPQLLSEEVQQRTTKNQPIEANPRSPFVKSQSMIEATLASHSDTGNALSDTCTSAGVRPPAPATPYSRINKRSMMSDLEKEVDSGSFGPIFSTPDANARAARVHREEGERHFAELVRMQNALKA